MKKHLFFFFLMAIYLPMFAQIPVEIFAGDKKASFDLMFFKFFKNKHQQNSSLLFFSRERAVVDYRQTPTENLPQFGFTEAISYNTTLLGGFAPVLVGQVLSRGTFGKAGIQYARISKASTIFGWSVVDLKKQPNMDLFLMLRFTPILKEKWQLFGQIELINTIQTVKNGILSLAQRIRLGVKRLDWQAGVGADFSAAGRKNWSTSQNSGIFLRHEF